MSIRARSRIYPGVLLLTSLTIIAAWPASATRQQTQVFRAGTDVVPVYATVRDRNANDLRVPSL